MTKVGVVKALTGSVQATSTDGTVRTLNVGDAVYVSDMIVTGASGAIEIELNNGQVLDLGRNSYAELDASMAGDHQAVANVEDEVASIQESLLAGDDPTVNSEPTAAGAGVTEDNEGHQAIFVNYLNPEMLPEAGFDTVGVANEFDEIIEASLIDLIEPEEDNAPIAGVTSALLDEDDLGLTQTEATDEAVESIISSVQGDFSADTGLILQSGLYQGVGDEAAGDELASPHPTVYFGPLNADYGLDGPGTVAFNPVNAQPEGLSSGGVPVQIWISEDGLTLIAYTITEGESGQAAEIIFSAQLDPVSLTVTAGIYAPLDHPDTSETVSVEENLLLKMAFTITDANGTQAQGVIELSVDDDSPVIEDVDSQEGTPLVVTLDEDDTANGVGDSDSPGDDETSASLILPVNFGADGPATTNPVEIIAEGIVDQFGNALTVNGESVVFSWNADTSTLVGSVNGEPVLEVLVTTEDWQVDVSVSLLSNLDHPIADEDLGIENNLDITLSYVATDADGDQATGSFVLSIDDDMPVIGTSETAVLDEEGLANGNAGGPEDNVTQGVDESTFSGTLNVSAGADEVAQLDFATMDGQQALVGTELVTYSWYADASVLTATGPRGDLFTVEITDASAAEYTVTLLDNVLHPSLNGEDGDDTENNSNVDLTFSVTDGDGDVGMGVLSLNFDDDTPVANADTDTTVEGLAEGNVISDEQGADAVGADGAQVTDIRFGEVSGEAGEEAGLTVEGEYGTLTIQSNGDYVYNYNQEIGSVDDIELTAFRLGESFLDGNGKFSADEASGEVSNGYGVKGTSGPNGQVPNQLNYSGSLSEALAFNFGGENVLTASVEVSRMFQTERGGEAMRWHAFDAEGNKVATGILSQNTEGPYTNTTDAVWLNNHTATFTIDDIGPFHTLVVEAIPYSRDGSSPRDDSDFFVEVTGFDVSPSPTGEYQDVFTYELTDGDGDSATATLTIDGNAASGQAQGTSAPVAVDNEESVDEDQTITGNVITDDNDGGGAASGRDWDADTPVLNLSISDVTALSEEAQVSEEAGVLTISTEYGTLTINADGSYEYVANGDATAALADGETAEDVFTYTLVDPDGNTSAPANLIISVTGTNILPVIEQPTSAEGNEDSAGIDVVLSASDEDGSVESFVIETLPEHGTLYLGNTLVTEGMSVSANSGEATLTFVPNLDWSDNNGDAPISFDYHAVDNEGGISDTASASISVKPITDAPLVTLSLTPVQTQAAFSTDNATVKDNLNGQVGNPEGFTVTALKQQNDTWVETGISIKDRGNPTGFGVAGNGRSNGANSELERGEKLFVELDNPGSSITFQLAWLNGSNETAVYTLTYDDDSTETFVIGGGSDRVDPPVTHVAPEGKTIKAIEFATPDSGPRARTSDYLIHKVSYEAAFVTYSVDILAETTDSDGSETITQLLVSTPEGVTLSDSQFVETVDGVSTWLLFVDDLVNDANDYSGPTIIEYESGDISVTGLTLTVPTSFDGDLVVSAEATAYDPEAPTNEAVALTGDEQANELLGGDEVNILTGGAGDDILTGGAGADVFVWQEGDQGDSVTPAMDVVTDFNTSEGDVLDLADILQGDALNHITDYLTLLQQGDDVVINVKPDGVGDVTQIITLEDTTVDQLVGADTSGMTEVDILNNLVGNGQLNVDAS